MRGVVHSGGTSVMPLAGKRVVLRSTAAANSQFGQTFTDASGGFEFKYPFQPADGSYYVQVDVSGDGQVLLMALLGPAVPDQVTVNELTTVAAAFGAAQFIDRDGVILAPSLPGRIAAGMSANIADPATGMSSGVLASSPNALQTNALGITRSLANLLASCVREPNRFLQPLFDLTTSTTPATSRACSAARGISPSTRGGTRGSATT